VRRLYKSFGVKGLTVPYDTQFFFLWRCSCKSGLGRLIVEVSRSHEIKTQPVGVPLTNDGLVAEVATRITHNQHNRRKSLPPAEFELAFSAIERLHTYVLDRAATSGDHFLEHH
jgi:hypothetical protein